jgi:hypothetical protein
VQERAKAKKEAEKLKKEAEEEEKRRAEQEAREEADRRLREAAAERRRSVLNHVCFLPDQLSNCAWAWAWLPHTFPAGLECLCTELSAGGSCDQER